MELAPEIWITFATLALVLVLLIAEVVSADAAFMGGLAIVVVTGVIPMDLALDGFASGTILALGSLYIVAAALRETGVLSSVGEHLLGKISNLRIALARMVIPVSVVSAFINNTPIVAMGIPALRTWARKHDISASMLLIPLSFASIYGGMCTLIGTSANLVAHGLLTDGGMDGFGFFELAGIGIPCAIIGWIYLIAFAPAILRRRPEADSRDTTGSEEELVSLHLIEDSPIDGELLGDAGLMQLPGLRLARIERGDESIEDLDEAMPLRGGDCLYYVSDEEELGASLDLGDYPGLEIVVSDVGEMESAAAASGREIERHRVVIRTGSRLVGRRLRDTGFEERFSARVREIRRGGRPVDRDDLGNVVLRPGDTLLLETLGDFRESFEDSPEFYVTSGYTDAERKSAAGYSKRQIAEICITVGVLVGIVTLTATGVLDIALSALLGAVVVVGLRIISPAEARDAIDWQVLIVIGAALGLGQAMGESGAAALIADGILYLAEDLGPTAILAAVVLSTVVLTEVITNNGAVALFFPIVISVAATQGIDPRPLVVGITVSASMSMLTPFGYQTNLMVYSAGDYRFADFTRIGLPLQIVFALLVIFIVPMIWSF